jgi:hypothetical protein
LKPLPPAGVRLEPIKENQKFKYSQSCISMVKRRRKKDKDSAMPEESFKSGFTEIPEGCRAYTAVIQPSQNLAGR